MPPRIDDVRCVCCFTEPLRQWLPPPMPSLFLLPNSGLPHCPLPLLLLLPLPLPPHCGDCLPEAVVPLPTGTPQLSCVCATAAEPAAPFTEHSGDAVEDAGHCLQRSPGLLSGEAVHCAALAPGTGEGGGALL